ncbi:diguanylate cyclase [Desulfofundulus thermobenzoicus]|uniref:Diguanylate cyclase n=1 Tax=Desulfofundulus thermobenzoicus TaxID=29376 RepID=A0A6N7IPS0_9FIRM|nr:diguanylate cyclase [Desulfofundulus thermobenzoicus]MQL51567.1 diguanylate cyclase [Desulfofundulus thermobenzoicus]
MRHISGIRLPRGRVTVSIGMATYPQSTRDISVLVQFTDSALYQAKKEGRNRLQTAADDMEPLLGR